MVYKRKRVYGPKRRPTKRRRLVRRRRPRTDYGVSHNQPMVSSVRRRGRRMLSKRKWRNALWNATRCRTHYTAVGTYSTTMAPPADLDNYRLERFKCFDDFTSVANWHNPDGATPATYNGRLIMRGGTEVMTISTEADETMDMMVQLMWVKPGGSIPAAAASIGKSISMTPYITNTELGNENTRLVKTWKFTLDRGQGCVQLAHKAKIKSYDAAQFSNGSDCMWWLVYVGNTVTGVATNVVTIVKSWSASFVPDHVLS